MKEATKFVFVVLCLASVFGFSAPAQAEQCDTAVYKEWAFHFPQASQKGQTMIVSQETLSNPENIRDGEDYSTWLAGFRTALLAAGFEGKKVSSFTIYRNPKDNNACVAFDEIEEVGQTQTTSLSNHTGASTGSKKGKALGGIASFASMALPLFHVVGYPVAFGIQQASGWFQSKGDRQTNQTSKPGERSEAASEVKTDSQGFRIVSSRIKF